ncbi:hypothetical protein BD310DRAFT_933566 [Dichomitus squalens]|uniref:Uncharacterized protein n=1 Tax=Dichomitus squalens TaxID=114155 RepID=A0A4Q9PMZ5_9APHY|nr:hypothetical protein BD310DRAFT_933566 [Dichomitus squalens]
MCSYFYAGPLYSHFWSIAPRMTALCVHGNHAGAHSVLAGLNLDGLWWPALYMSTGQRRRCGIVLPLLQIPCSRNAAYKTVGVDCALWPAFRNNIDEPFDFDCSD